MLRTEHGIIRVALLDTVAPGTVRNFLALARKGFFNGLTFHRVIPGVLIQTGDPKGDGTGGPGYSIPAELNDRTHRTGAVAMARASDPNSAGSQFYLCLSPMPSLDRTYTVFGQVYEGLDVAGSVQKGDRLAEVTIEHVEADRLPAEARP